VITEIGWTTEVIGLVVPATSGVAEEQEAALRTMREVPGVTVWAQVRAEPPPASTGLLLTAVSGAALLSILATWIVVGLASAESRPDLATISAVGASPRTRRRLVGAQAGVLSIVGTALGLVTGVFFGGILVLAERTRSGPVGWTWELELPWLFLAILASAGPLLAIGGAAAVTRSRLPLTRRLAS
jgi:putative ABC transport system permease protein